MAKKKKREPARQSPRRSTSARPSFGWVPQPVPPTIDEIVSSGRYERFGVTRDLLEAQQRLREYMTSPETIERAAFERRPGRVGPETFLGSYVGPRIRQGKLVKENCVVCMVQRKIHDRERICESVRL